MSTKFSGLGYASAFDLNGKKPLDVRMVVDTLADRNGIAYTYPSMPVSVLGAPVVVGGVPTYPNMTHWRCLVDKNPSYGGPTTSAADWLLESAPAGLTQGGYKGPWDAAGNVPNLTAPAYQATLVPGDYFKVSVAGGTALNNVAGWAQNDSAFWDGQRWARFANTNPQAVDPLYDATQGASFQADVLALIRLSALTEWAPGTDYGRNAYVKHSYQEGGKPFVDTYAALAALPAAAAALPTDLTPNPGWQLVTTTNGRLLGGTATANDARGRPATGVFTPSNRTAGEFLTPEEVDARIKQFGGASNGPILGGNAGTFLTADPAETARN